MSLDPTAIRVAAPFKMWALADPATRVPRAPHGVWTANSYQGLNFANAVMVVDVVLGDNNGGVRFRAATVPLKSIASFSSNDDRSGRPSLIAEPPWQQAISLGDATSQARSFVFSFLPDIQLDIAQMIAAGIPPQGIAEVALEFIKADGSSSGQSSRFVICRGVVDGLKFGGRFPSRTGGGAGTDLAGNRIARGFEVAELEVADPREICQTWLPPWVIDSDANRFAAPHSSAIGARLPIVINGFGNIPAVRVTSNAVGAQQFVFATGYGGSTSPWTVNASTGVKVNSVTKTSGDATYGWVHETTVDGYGVPLQRIRFTNAATAWADSDAVHVTCTLAAAQDKQNVVEVVRDVCSRFAPFGLQGLTQRLFAEAGGRLPASLQVPNVLINGSSGGSAGNVLDFIEKTLLGSYPMISMVWEEGGYGPVLTDWRAQAVAKVVVGTPLAVKRSSIVQASKKSEQFNAFTFRYAYDPLLDVYAKVVVRDATTSGVCAYSERFIGQRAMDPIESPFVQDDATANYVCDWLVDHFALSSFVVQYDALPVAQFALRRGDTVLLTDPEFDWTDARAIVEATDYVRGRCTVTYRVFQRFVDVGGAAVSAPWNV